MIFCAAAVADEVCKLADRSDEQNYCYSRHAGHRVFELAAANDWTTVENNSAAYAVTSEESAATAQSLA